MITDWDDAYANMAHIDGSDALPDQWVAQAQAYRDGPVQVEEDIAYGSHPREVFDLVWPEVQPKGLLVFIHGGYWMRLDKSYWTDLAEGARANGWAVCLPSYTLAPEARISAMTAQMGAAITAAAARVSGPICLSGHSAGGHLAARMVCEDTPLAPEVLARVARVTPISGVHDLRPLLRTAMNETLHLDEAEACTESPALLRPATSAPITAWVGGGERPEFVRQSQILAQMWHGLGAETTCVVDANHHHFFVLDAMRAPDSPLTRCLLGL